MSSDVIALVSPAGRVLYASASSASVFGYLPEEIVGRNTFDLIHPEDRDHSRQSMYTALARPSHPHRVKARVRRKNGGWCCVEGAIVNLLAEPRIAQLVVTCREVGAGDQAARNTDELVRSNARLEDFAYAVAHDLREPLRTISMFTEILLAEVELDPQGKQKECAQFIRDGVTRVSALFEGLHAFAIHGFDEPSRPLNLTSVVDGVLQDLGHAIKAGNAVVTVDPLPMVLGNEKHLGRVFQNLIANAIKYRSQRPVEIHISAERPGPEWVIRVRDNGVGIAAEYHELVFGLFQRLHGPETSGAGIGLAICRKVIEAMGGTIWIESAPGAGSTFCFTIADAKSRSSAMRKDASPVFAGVAQAAVRK